MTKEKEKLQKILNAVTYAFSEFKCGFKPTKTSGELFGIFKNALKEKLGEYEIVYDYIWGEDSKNIDGVSDEGYVPKRGDSVIMDISVGWDGLWCDVCRTFFVEVISPEQKHIFELIKESIKAGEAELKANTCVCKVFDEVNLVYEKDNKKLIHHAGHRIGEKPIMEPRFIAESNEKIKENQFYTIESGFYDGFGIRLENDYLVTENQTENLFENLMSLNIEDYKLI